MMNLTKLQQEYTKDFYGWIMHNAALLRQRKFSEIDVDHVAEELEDMGGSAKRELVNRLGILLAHLLKWKYQPRYQGKSWKYIIKEQRRRLSRLLKKNPSLKHDIDESFKEAYGDAIFIATKETKLDEEDFPETCPFSLSECLDDDFFPEA